MNMSQKRFYHLLEKIEAIEADVRRLGTIMTAVTTTSAEVVKLRKLVENVAERTDLSDVRLWSAGRALAGYPAKGELSDSAVRMNWDQDTPNQQKREL